MTYIHILHANYINGKYMENNKQENVTCTRNMCVVVINIKLSFVSVE